MTRFARIVVYGVGGLVALAAAGAAAAGVATGDASQIESIPDLVGFWTFGEAPGQQRVSQGTPSSHPLSEVAKAGAAPTIGRLDEGPFSGHAAHFDGQHYLRLPYADTGDLNINGAAAEVSMIAFIRLDTMSKTVAGMWYEGGGAYDDVGSRQYALLMDMPMYGGNDQVTPHISAEGGVSRRADGSAMPWCVDYAASDSTVETGTWVSVGFTYDSDYIRAFYNGAFEERPVDPDADNRTDSYFTDEGPGGEDRGMNPYYHGKPIFEYDPAIHSETKPQGGADFTVGSRYSGGSFFGEPMRGAIGGLAVFDRALTESEMLQAHESANLALLNAGPPPPPGTILLTDFENTVGSNNISINAYNANTGEHWTALFGPGADGSNDRDSGDGLRIADSTLGDTGFFLAGIPSGADTVGFAWTDDGPGVEVADLETISARLNNKSTDDRVRFALLIGDQWYASDDALGIDPAGIGYSNWTNAEQVSLDVVTDASAWRMLEVDPGTSLSLGATASSDLAGTVDAVGVFMEIDGAGLVRLDDFIVTPEPATLALLALGGFGLLARRRRRQAA